MTTELKPDGGNITVTEQNKKEYVALVVPFLLRLFYSDLLCGQRSCRVQDFKPSP